MSNKECIIVYPCLNGDKITMMGTPNPHNTGYCSNTQYYLVSGSEAKRITKEEAHSIMEAEGFFEVMPGECPTTNSGVIHT
jgi:hypothetical protein